MRFFAIALVTLVVQFAVTSHALVTLSCIKNNTVPYSVTGEVFDMRAMEERVSIVSGNTISWKLYASTANPWGEVANGQGASYLGYSPSGFAYYSTGNIGTTSDTSTSFSNVPDNRPVPVPSDPVQRYSRYEWSIGQDTFRCDIFLSSTVLYVKCTNNFEFRRPDVYKIAHRGRFIAYYTSLGTDHKLFVLDLYTTPSLNPNPSEQALYNVRADLDDMDIYTASDPAGVYYIATVVMLDNKRYLQVLTSAIYGITPFDPATLNEQRLTDMGMEILLIPGSGGDYSLSGISTSDSLKVSYSDDGVLAVYNNKGILFLIRQLSNTYKKMVWKFTDDYTVMKKLAFHSPHTPGTEDISYRLAYVTDTGLQISTCVECGHGTPNFGKQCDDNNSVDGDGCSSTCQAEHGFNCDGISCVSVCGDKKIAAGREYCDDGDIVNGDGCSSLCTIEHGYTCPTEGQLCVTTCGDGIKAGTEDCDDGNLINGDGCSLCQTDLGYTCPIEGQLCQTCGDGKITGTEMCDDGNLDNGDGCSSSCALEGNFKCAVNGQPVTCCRNECIDNGGTCSVANVCTCPPDGQDGIYDRSPTTYCANRDCNYTPWTDDDFCTEPCVGGVITQPGVISQTRAYVSPSTGTGTYSNCEQSPVVSRQIACNTHACRCEYSEWADDVRGCFYLSFTQTCGQGGRKRQTRSITFSDISLLCEEDLSRFVPCEVPCPVDCQGTWSDGTCSNTCGPGTKSRVFTVTTTPANGGAPCPDPLTQIVPCTTPCCGNGVKEEGEQCDDGGNENGNGCSDSCQFEHGYKSCDTVNGQYKCTGVCGDGEKASNEKCDDGDTVSGDGCDNICMGETGWKCPNEGIPCVTDCGDEYVVEGKEECDGGLNPQGTGCRADCTPEANYVCAVNTNTRHSTCYKCGNGIKEYREQCDDGGNGNGDGCSSACDIEDNWSCIGGDTVQSTCFRCGDGKIEGSEECDDGGNANGDGCSSTCRLEPGYNCYTVNGSYQCFSVCGDGKKAATEACDDGNRVNGDGCSFNCTPEPGFICTGTSPTVCTSVCGDSIITKYEDCDVGGTPTPQEECVNCKQGQGYKCTLSGTNTADCVTVCGDGVKMGDEQCDDGNTSNGDGCSSVCIIENGYACVEDIDNKSTCSAAWCGDGVAVGAEECDDWGNADGDGCSSTCKQEPGYRCVRTDAQSIHCIIESSLSLCGNGIKGDQANEGCDDGNTRDGDGCSSFCQLEEGYTCTGAPSTCNTVCGDGIITGNEKCEDAYYQDKFCPPNSNCMLAPLGLTCTNTGCYPICGDGIVAGGEECDDSNQADGDGCSSKCRKEFGFTCTNTATPSVCSKCGNGKVEGSEKCDDGNNASGDGCSDTCTVESKFLCAGTAPSVCSVPLTITLVDTTCPLEQTQRDIVLKVGRKMNSRITDANVRNVRCTPGTPRNRFRNLQTGGANIDADITGTEGDPSGINGDGIVGVASVQTRKVTGGRIFICFFSIFIVFVYITNHHHPLFLNLTNYYILKKGIMNCSHCQRSGLVMFQRFFYDTDDRPLCDACCWV